MKLEDPASDDLVARYRYLMRTESVQAADRWLDQIGEAIDSLTSLPDRCPLAPENDAFPVVIRQLITGSTRIYFTVSNETKAAHVLHIRHQARRPGLG